MTRARRVVALVAAGVLLAACGGDAPSRPPPTGDVDVSAVVARLVAEPARGAAPLAVLLDAAGSTCPGGCAFTWDLGTGQPEVGEAAVERAFDVVGQHRVTVWARDRVTGITSDATVAVEVLAPAPREPQEVPQECATLLPGVIPPPVDVDVAAGDEYAPGGCGATTDGAGEFVALESFFSPRRYWYRFVPMGGGSIISSVSLGGMLVPQANGYLFKRAGSVFTPWNYLGTPLQVFDATGHVVHSGGTLGLVLGVRPIPSGGSILTTYEKLADGAYSYRLERVDADGTWRGAYASEYQIEVASVTTTGDILARAAVPPRLRWLDATLSPMTDWFDYAPAGAGTMALADGSVALRVWAGPGAWWSTWSTLRPGTTEWVPGPEWLNERVGADLRLVRGNRAYAAIRLTGDASGACAESGCACPSYALEVLTADGRSCGTVSLPFRECALVWLGADGTVFSSTLSRLDLSLSKWGTCNMRWWPGLLR